ncbi:hypothetical protein, partial [Streptomyces sp. JV190]|uniref:hypothetical protein n=1 Tax=Streptomyces sp. JV190 TaxID=3002533 RepID=UPI002E7981C6
EHGAGAGRPLPLAVLRAAPAGQFGLDGVRGHAPPEDRLWSAGRGGGGFLCFFVWVCVFLLALTFDFCFL